MTRPTLTQQADGIYRPSLEDQIHERMHPVERRSDWRIYLETAGYLAATVFAGIGILIGMIVICGFAAVFWGIDKLRRGKR